MSERLIHLRTEQVEEAWKFAERQLDREIDLFWKRGTYFATILGGILVAYEFVDRRGDADGYERIVLSSFGILVSIAWFLVNLGSKHWQDVWEDKLTTLQDEWGRELYRSDLGGRIDRVGRWRPSVSRTATLVSFATIILFVAATAIAVHENSSVETDDGIFLVIVYVVLLALFLRLTWTRTR